MGIRQEEHYGTRAGDHHAQIGQQSVEKQEDKADRAAAEGYGVFS